MQIQAHLGRQGLLSLAVGKTLLGTGILLWYPTYENDVYLVPEHGSPSCRPGRSCWHDSCGSAPCSSRHRPCSPPPASRWGGSCSAASRCTSPSAPGSAQTAGWAPLCDRKQHQRRFIGTRMGWFYIWLESRSERISRSSFQTGFTVLTLTDWTRKFIGCKDVLVRRNLHPFARLSMATVFESIQWFPSKPQTSTTYF